MISWCKSTKKISLTFVDFTVLGYKCNKMSTTANASNDYLKREKKLWHWLTAATGGRCRWCVPAQVGHMRERGEMEWDGQRCRGGFVWISPTVIILINGRHTQHCTDSCDGQILNQMQV